MKLKHNFGGKRKAVSPVLATVILIAITLIAAVAIAGFVFGLFGSFTSTAQVSVTTTALVNGAPPTGSLVAANTGTANTKITGITLTYGGTSCTPVLNPVIGTGVTVTAGGSATLTLAAANGCGASTSGEQFTGSLSLSNGGQVQFTGTFQ